MNNSRFWRKIMQGSQTVKFLNHIDMDVLERHSVALINFRVSWSVLCKIQESIMENVAKVFKDEVLVVNVDVEQNPEAKSQYQIDNLPTILILRNGVEVKRFEGVQPEETLGTELNNITESAQAPLGRKSFWTSFKDREMEHQLFQKEILIIDDDPDITFCIRTILEEFNFKNIGLASDYDSTIEYLETNTPHLIFLNIMMHNKEGHKIMSTIRKNKRWNDIPILISVGPIEPSRVYEDSFKDSAVLKNGKYVEWPRDRQSFILLVRHMLLYRERTKTAETQSISFRDICPISDQNGK
jgi:thioredoxin 1